MKHDHAFQRKKRTTPLSSFPTTLYSTRSLAPISSRPSTDSPPDLDHPRRFGHSLEQISIYPPEPAALERPNDASNNQENRTGLPTSLKAGIEAFSGLSLNDVQVHYNSPRPAEVQALACTQGEEIHVGPAQEEYLAHEAWHVVQQKQGRVSPTSQMKDVQINDDPRLEQEADEIGKRVTHGDTSLHLDSNPPLQRGVSSISRNVLQAGKMKKTKQPEKAKQPLNLIAKELHAGNSNRSTTGVGRLSDKQLVVATQITTNKARFKNKAQEVFGIDPENIEFITKPGLHTEVALEMAYDGLDAIGASQPFCTYCQNFLDDKSITKKGDNGDEPSDKWLSPEYIQKKDMVARKSYPYAALFNESLGTHETFWTSDDYKASQRGKDEAAPNEITTRSGRKISKE